MFFPYNTILFVISDMMIKEMSELQNTYTVLLMLTVETSTVLI